MLDRVCGLLAIVSLGCSSGAGAPPPASDASIEDTAASETIDEGGAPDGDAELASDAASDGEPVCNSLVLSGADVALMQVTTPPPTLGGGTIADGTYVLTKLVEYVGPSGPTDPGGTFRSTLSLSGASYSMRWLERSETSATAGTMTHDVSSLTLAQTCPGGEGVTLGFEATPTSLTLLRTFGGGSALEATYERE